MSVTKLLAISLGAILTNNFIFSQFLGICPFLGVSKKSDTAVGMGLAVTFVMGLASAFCFGVNKLLVALGLDYMQTVAFILVVASLVQFIEMFLKKSMPTLYTCLLYTSSVSFFSACFFSFLASAHCMMAISVPRHRKPPTGSVSIPAGT